VSGQSPACSASFLVVVEGAVGVVIEAVVLDDGFLLGENVYLYLLGTV
jgi:hypothetical protein